MRPCPACASRRSLLVGGLALAAAGATGVQAEPAPRPPLIDVHHHAIPDFWFAAAEKAIHVQAGGVVGPQWRGWTPEKSMEAMDRNGVAAAVLSITSPGTWFGKVGPARALTRRCNERLAEVVTAHPQRFGFNSVLALPDVEGSLREIEHGFDVLKADGIGLMTSYRGRYLGDPAFAPIFDELNRRKAVVYVHPVGPACCVGLMPEVAPNFIEFLHDTNRTILSLMFGGTLKRCPDITFVFSHAGGSLPMMAGRVTGLLPTSPEASKNVPDGFPATFARLYFELAQSANRPAFNALKELAPMSHVMFGTDFPIIPVERTAQGLQGLGLSGADFAAIANGNARRLYPRLAERLRVTSS